MAARLCLLLLLALNTCEGGATVAVGGACNTTNTCTDAANVVCESSVCKIKAEKTCTATDKCVPHSTCPASGTGVCTCDIGYAPSSDGLCAVVPEKKVGAECTSSPCDGDNVECVDVAGADASKKYCKCKGGFTANTGDTGCSTVLANRIGGSCTTSPAPDSCATNAECSAAANGVCKCKPGFQGNTGDADCIKISANKVGAECNSDTCEGSNVQCATGSTDKKYCTCQVGFTADPGDTDCDNPHGGSTQLSSAWLLAGSVAMMLTIFTT